VCLTTGYSVTRCIFSPLEKNTALGRSVYLPFRKLTNTILRGNGGTKLGGWELPRLGEGVGVGLDDHEGKGWLMQETFRLVAFSI